MNPTFSLRTRQEKGSTPVLREWGATTYQVPRNIFLVYLVARTFFLATMVFLIKTDNVS